MATPAWAKFQALQTKAQQGTQLNGMVQPSAELPFKPVVESSGIPARLDRATGKRQQRRTREGKKHTPDRSPHARRRSLSGVGAI